MAHMITQKGDGTQKWYSISEGRDMGAPQGGWSTNQAKALQFARAVDAAEFKGAFLSNQSCEVEAFREPA